MRARLLQHVTVILRICRLLHSEIATLQPAPGDAVAWKNLIIQVGGAASALDEVKLNGTIYKTMAVEQLSQNICVQ